MNYAAVQTGSVTRQNTKASRHTHGLATYALRSEALQRMGYAVYYDRGGRCRAFYSDYFNHAWKQLMAQEWYTGPCIVVSWKKCFAGK